MGWVAQCEIAVGAVRAQLRSMRIDPETVSASEAHAVLDELARSEPEFVACQWYQAADDRQLSWFYRDWEEWLDEQRWYRYLAGGHRVVGEIDKAEWRRVSTTRHSIYIPLTLLMPLSCQAKYEFAGRDLDSGRKNCLQSDRRAIVHVTMSIDEAISADC